MFEIKNLLIKKGLSIYSSLKKLRINIIFIALINDLRYSREGGESRGKKVKRTVKKQLSYLHSFSERVFMLFAC